MKCHHKQFIAQHPEALSLANIFYGDQTSILASSGIVLVSINKHARLSQSLCSGLMGIDGIYLIFMSDIATQLNGKSFIE